MIKTTYRRKFALLHGQEIRCAACGLALALLIGCNSPSPALLGATKESFEVNGTQYVMFYNSSKAEVIRTSRVLDKSASQSVIMIERLEQVSGCSVLDNDLIDGTILKASLSCEDA